MITANLLIIIKKYGILSVFAGTFLEGELVLVTAAILAGDGLLNPVSVWMSASLGAWTGHVFWFFIGRKFGSGYILPRLKRLGPRIEEVNRIVLNHPKAAIFILQYLYGMRVIGAMGLGITKLSFARFMLYEALNCMLWALVVFTIGYVLGETFVHVLHGWFRWAWMGLSFLVLVLFFRHLKLFLHSKMEMDRKA
ncbi:MAG: DedA family protein [Nitrospirota bacterium]|nr:DedA family protein [Nitrospirota bacterium]